MQELNEAYGAYDQNILEDELKDYLSKAAKLLSKSTSKHIVACGCCHNYYMDPKNCEDECKNIKLMWVHPVLINYLPEYIEVDVTDL